MPNFSGDHKDKNTVFLEQFIYGVSHDLGAPVRHLVQFSDLFQKRAAGKLDEKELSWLKFIIEGGQRAQKMSESLLYLSRLASQHSKPDTCDVLALIEGEIGLLKNAHDSSIADAANRAEIRIEGTGGEFMLINSHWRTLVLQLVKNAVVFQPTTENHQPVVVLTLETSPSKLRLSVADNGIGVSPQNLPLLTTPFKRFNPEPDYPGLGVGLTYVAYIALLNGADLDFGRSSLGGLLVNYCQTLEPS